MKVQSENLQKAEEEVVGLNTCLKQVHHLIARHEPSFTRLPELSQLYPRLISIMGAQEAPKPRIPNPRTPI